MSSSSNRMARRRFRARKAIKRSGSDRLRMCVFRSNQHIYAQIIDDRVGHTVASGSTVETQIKRESDDLKGIERARKVGYLVGEKALKVGIEHIKFDRGPYRYHGLVKALAEGAREAGLKF